MSSNPSADAGLSTPDPVFVNSRRDAMVIFLVWLVALLWAVPCCWVLGYSPEFDPSRFSTIWGIPTWVFWGIAVPWLVADVFTIWYCMWKMADDDLGEAPEDASVAGHGSARLTEAS